MKRLITVILLIGITGCSTLPFETGRVKEQYPYPEGEWVGPVPVDVAAREVFEASEGRRNRTGYLFYDVRAEWKKLKSEIRPGDEIWEFRMRQFVVDGGNRYLGFSLVRGRTIVAHVITGVFEP